MPTDNKSTPTTTSDAIKDTPTADRNVTRVDPPTWTELMQSRTKAAPRGNNMSQEKETTHTRICISQKFHASVSDTAPNKTLPVIGKLSCFELLTPKAANALLLERRQQSKDQRGGWADAWYARWLVRLQFTTVLGNDHIKRAEELMRSSKLQTREIARAVIADDDERKAKFQVVTVDESMVGWPDSVAGFYRRLFAPNLSMGKRYVESWQNGKQQLMLTKFWDGAVNFSGIKLAAKAFSNMAKAWEEENGNDKK
ncbi:hypothetical protein H4S07_003156 [Coemansia furcata]|uniref:Uncharacterized protein n=1 Tax=Coemansia furcata TaxID=417177 RepID=A0ACC1LIF4_9FUNG|nr:hypothetical protein H4S07_003156 [Coemansia furcata]